MAFSLTARPVSPNAVYLLGVFLTPVMMLPAALAAQAEAEGRSLFETQCARCHAGPASLKTEVTHVAAKLRGGTVRQHRFTLSETQLNALTEYLRSGAS